MVNYEFGAGLWMFQQFIDRYATDAYGPAVSTLEAIERACSGWRHNRLDLGALRATQERQDALEAQRIVMDMLLGMGTTEVSR